LISVLYKAGVLTDMRRNMSDEVWCNSFKQSLSKCIEYVWNWNGWRMEGNIWPLNYEIISIASKQMHTIHFFQNIVSSFT